jgi:hypothetical protein
LELIVDAISLQSVAAPDGSEELLNSHIGQPMSARSQPTLFEPAPSAEPNGLTYVEDAIDAATERTLASFVETLDVHPFAFRGFTGHRRTISFGWRYDFNGGGFARANPCLVNSPRPARWWLRRWASRPTPSSNAR